MLNEKGERRPIFPEDSCIRIIHNGKQWYATVKDWQAFINPLNNKEEILYKVKNPDFILNENIKEEMWVTETGCFFKWED